MTGLVRLRSGPSVADISVDGAEILHWNVSDRALLWSPDRAVWPETAPLLFPVVGWTRNAQIRVGEASYPLGLHGFARSQRFCVVRLNRSSVRLVLDSNPRTLALYPFCFRFSVDYVLHDRALTITLNVSNRGFEPMPYACGLHPGFRWPLSGATQSGHRILFDAPEEPHVPLITRDGLFASGTRLVPLDENRLELTSALFAQEALCFLNVKSQGLLYEASDGTALRMGLTDFPHIALWSKPPASFLAIEAWTGHGDPETFSGDLSAKPSMRILPPGGSASHEAVFRFQPNVEATC